MLWLRRRAALAAAAGVIAVIVFAGFATVGLPINSRYGFLVAALLCIFCGAGVFGWRCSSAGTDIGGRWQIAAVVLAAALVAYTPATVKSAHRQLDELSRPARHRRRTPDARKRMR